MAFKDDLVADAVNTFANSDEFAEDIVYTPKGQAAKTISAIVNRRQPAPSPENSGRSLTSSVEILIANDPDDGIISVNVGGDTAQLPERVGGNVATFVVADIIEQDDGMWHLRLER